MFWDEWKNICCDAHKSSERCISYFRIKCISGSDFTNKFKARARIFKLGSRHLGKARILPFVIPISGIFAKPLGDKLQNNECLNLICQFDFVILCETWKTIIDIAGYRSVVSVTSKLGNNGRN